MNPVRFCAAALAVAALSVPVIAGSSPAAASSEVTRVACNSTAYLQFGYRQIEWFDIPARNGGFGCTLLRGDRGKAVEALQKTLNRCHGAHIGVDGRFGPSTERALKKAQRNSGIRGDGIYGRNTRRIIDHEAQMGQEPGKPSTCAPPKLALRG